MWGPNPHHLAAAAAVVALSLAVSACGSSSKPGYCDEKDSLQRSIDGLTKVDVRANGVSELQTQLRQVSSDADALVAAGKADFPDQTTAITTSVAALRSAIAAFPSSPSGQDVARIGVEVAGVLTSVKDFNKAAGDACS